jgi:hypothetical protein
MPARRTNAKPGTLSPAAELGTVESDAMVAEVAGLRKFQANRAALLAEWGYVEPAAAAVAEPAPAEQPQPEPAVARICKSRRPSLTERRAAKVAADLARWQRKLKLAQTKVKKLRAKNRYYIARQSAAIQTPAAE